MPCYVGCLPQIAIHAENLKDVGDVRCHGSTAGSLLLARDSTILEISFPTDGEEPATGAW
jgi:hypothetical protein